MADTPEEIVPEPSDGIPNGTPRFQLSQSDLEDLERILPQWADLAMDRMDTPKRRTQITRVKQILSDIRWNYGPWTGVTIIPAGPSEPE